MSVITFDTLKYTKTLIEAGVPQRQAEGQAEALAQVIDDQLATKQDLKELENNLRHDMKDLEIRLVTRVGTLIGACTVISTAILGILISIHH